MNEVIICGIYHNICRHSNYVFNCEAVMKPNNTAIPKQYSLIKLYNTFIFKHPTCFMITVSFSGMTFAVKQYEQNISITFDIHGSVHCR